MSIGPTPEQAIIGFIVLMMGLGMLVFLRVLTIYRAHELMSYKKALAVQQARAQFMKSAYRSGVGDDGSVVDVGDGDMGDVVEIMEGEEVDGGGGSGGGGGGGGDAQLTDETLEEISETAPPTPEEMLEDVAEQTPASPEPVAV